MSIRILLPGRGRKYALTDGFSSVAQCFVDVLDGEIGLGGENVALSLALGDQTDDRCDRNARAAMFYWLWRVRGRRTLPVLVRHDSVPLVTRAR